MNHAVCIHFTQTLKLKYLNLHYKNHITTKTLFSSMSTDLWSYISMYCTVWSSHNLNK